MLTYCSSIALLAAGAVGFAPSAKAHTFNTSPDWDVELDTNIAYSLGMRAQGQNPMIANNPFQQGNEFKFPHAGDIVTNRVDIGSELIATYQNDYGIDVSVDGWKDFAYNGGVPGNPSMGGLLRSNPDGHYSSYTFDNYNLGGELENAFIFGNFTPDNIPVSVKIGRFTEYWGNALFSGFQAISYGQNPIDIIKAVDAPGTEVKDLFLPRGQVSVHVQALPDLSLGFQYDFEYRANQFPEGGTLLGVTDFIFEGADTNPALGGVPHISDHIAPDNDGNFGLEAQYSPDWLNGTAGLYFRQFDDPSAYAVFNMSYNPATGAPTGSLLSYARHVRLYGASFEKDIGTVATNIEASVRTNTGLYGNPAGGGPTGTDGPRGETLNVVANGIQVLTPTPLWQTGNLVGEIAWTRLLGVTHDKADYQGPSSGCNSEASGCATRDEVNINVLFDPSWLQVYPGVDIDAPMSIAAGIHGNGQTLAITGVGDNAASYSWSAGIHALIKQKYNVTLSYAGDSASHNGIGINPINKKSYWDSGSAEYMWNDKGRITLVLSTAF
jgi:hypothetical protein